MTLGYFALGILVVLLSYWLTVVLCSSTSKLYLIDLPNERSLHSVPTPRTGGIAIIGTFFAGVVTLVLLDKLFDFPGKNPGVLSDAIQSTTHLWIIATALGVAAVSFCDDRIGLLPGLRFGIQVLAAAAIVWGAHLTVTTISFPLLGSLPLGWFAFPFTMLFIMWMANLYNFMDGMDGFAGGMTAVGFGLLSFIAWMGGHLSIALLSLLIAGASIGFLVFNLPPAKIFMGDVGSVSLGFLAGTLSVMGIHDGAFDIWVPVLIFSPFIVDATLTLFIRLLRGEKVWHAHRQHYYQRMVLAGWGHRRTLVAEYCLMLACGTSAILYWTASEPLRLALLLAWSAAYSLLAFSVKAFEISASAELRGCPRGQS